MDAPVNGSLDSISLYARMQIIISYYGLLYTPNAIANANGTVVMSTSY
jgi:hypothetical protein